MWTGLDGTQIITHMTPVDNYDSQVRPRSLPAELAEAEKIDAGYVLFPVCDKCGVDDILRGVKNNRNVCINVTHVV